MAGIEMRVVFEPVKEIVVHRVVEFPSDQKLAEYFLPFVHATPVLFYWCDGLVLARDFMVETENEFSLDEFLKFGRLHWKAVYFAEMPKYKSKVKVGKIEIPVVNESYSPEVKQVVKWLKKENPKSECLDDLQYNY